MFERRLLKKEQEEKWQRLRQNWLQGEDMPLVKKPGQKTLDNGSIAAQNGNLEKHCTIPVQIPEGCIKDVIKTCSSSNGQDKNLAKNFWLT